MSMEDLYQFRAKIFKSLADPLRLQILEFIREEEKCVCEIVPHLAVSQPLVSRQLKILRNRGLVTFRKDGTKRLYSVTEPQIFKIIDALTPKIKTSLSQIVVEQML